MQHTPTPVAPPLYQRLSLVILGLSVLVCALWLTQSLVVPLLFSLLLAILLDRLVKLLTRWGINRIVGISLSVTFAMLLLAGLGYFIATQAAHFSSAIPQLKEKVVSTGDDLEHWVRHSANVQPKQLHDAVDKVKENGMEKGGAIVGKTLTTVGTLFGFFFLLPVFTFLIIYYKDLFHNFLVKLFSKKGQGRLEDVLGQTKGVVQSFLIGRMFETLILAAMNWVGLMLIGIPYALLLAVLGALMNLVPYLGMIVATFMTVLIAFALQDLNAALWVFALYCVVQFIDNHFLVPLVVGSRVEMNAFFSIVVVIAGGMLWGIPGMFLAIPVTAILKVIFDRVPALEPWGYVLGMGDGETDASGKEKPRDPSPVRS
jgi:predicted PurR-regulated permease PerM